MKFDLTLSVRVVNLCLYSVINTFDRDWNLFLSEFARFGCTILTRSVPAEFHSLRFVTGRD